MKIGFAIREIGFLYILIKLFSSHIQKRRVTIVYTLTLIKNLSVHLIGMKPFTHWKNWNKVYTDDPGANFTAI